MGAWYKKTFKIHKYSLFIIRIEGGGNEERIGKKTHSTIGQF